MTFLNWQSTFFTDNLCKCRTRISYRQILARSLNIFTPWQLKNDQTFIDKNPPLPLWKCASMNSDELIQRVKNRYNLYVTTHYINRTPGEHAMRHGKCLQDIQNDIVHLQCSENNNQNCYHFYSFLIHQRLFTLLRCLTVAHIKSSFIHTGKVSRVVICSPTVHWKH